MPHTYRTEQEAFWSGAFGTEYIARNRDHARWIKANTALFADILRHTYGVGRVIELGANVGLNLFALRSLLPSADIEAVEINPAACAELRASKVANAVHEGSLLDFRTKLPADLIFTKGVLIHVNPEALPQAYDALYRASRRYVLVAEYYNPAPLEVPYRGHTGRLFKRDFAGEILDTYIDLVLVAYGFVWKRDPNFPQDDLTWFLMEKRSARDGPEP